MNHKRNNHLMALANNHVAVIVKDNTIAAAYNGQVAAFSVAVAMSGLLPTLANYIGRSDNKDVPSVKVLDVLAKMLHEDDAQRYAAVTDAKSLFKYALQHKDENDNVFRNDVVDCAVALKQVVRTFELKKD